MKNQKGFSIIELMVGILISLLVVMAVMASAKYLEVQKRLTVGVDGSLETMTLTTNTLANDIRMAGFGLTYGGNFQCKKSTIIKNGVTAATDASGFLRPIEFVDGGAGLSDTIRIVYADSPTGIATTTTNAAMAVFTKPTFDAASGNSTIVSYAVPYTIAETNTALAVKGALTNDGANGCQVVAYDSSTGMPTVANATVPIGATEMPISDFQDITYSIKNNALWVHDNFANGTAGDTEVADNVAFMKVYGLVAGTWFAAKDLTPFSGATSLSAQLGATAPSAVKLFIVAREQNFNAKVNGVCTATTQASLEQSLPWYEAGKVTDPAVDLTGTADWDCYKYKAVELVVPLKNLILGNQA